METKLLSAFLVGVTLLQLLVILRQSSGFSFDGTTMECDGVNVTGYPKMREQFLRCNKTAFEMLKKNGIKPEGFGPLLCTGLCGFLEDDLIDKATGLLNKTGLDNYKEMFEAVPEKVRKGIKDTFYNCFEQHKNDTVYNSTDPNTCTGMAGVGMCINHGINSICKIECKLTMASA